MVLTIKPTFISVSVDLIKLFHCAVGFLSLLEIFNCSFILLLIKVYHSTVQVEVFDTKYVFKVITATFERFERIKVDFLRWIVIQLWVITIRILTLLIEEISCNRIFLDFNSFNVRDELNVKTRILAFESRELIRFISLD